MNNSIWQVIASTPWWIYALFFYLMYIGYLATKPKMVPIASFFLLPALFIAGSITIMFTLLQVNTMNLACFGIMLLLGSGLGWLQYSINHVKASVDDKHLLVPGTWSILIICIASFFTKFYFNYQLDFTIDMIKTPRYSLLMMSIYGLFAGLLLGRMMYAKRAIKHSLNGNGLTHD